MYQDQKGNMNSRKLQNSWNRKVELYDPYKAQGKSYNQNIGYGASGGGQSYDNYGMTSGNRKRQSSSEFYGNTKQQKMGLDEFSSASETEKLLKMLVEQNKLIKKQQEIIESRGDQNAPLDRGQNVSLDQSEMGLSQSRTSGRDSYNSGTNIWDDTEYGQSDLRSSSFGGYQEKSRGQDYQTLGYSDSGSKSFDLSRGNLQKSSGSGFTYNDDTNRRSSTGPYVKSVPISQLKQLNKSQKNKRQRQKKSTAQSQAWGQRSDKGQGQRDYSNRDQGYDNFSKSDGKNSMLKNRMQKSAAASSHQDEFWGKSTTNQTYGESGTLNQDGGMTSYDYKHGKEEGDYYYDTTGMSQGSTQQRWKEQKSNSSSNKSGKYGGTGYSEGNLSYDKDGYLTSSGTSSQRMQNKHRNQYGDFDTIPGRKFSDKNDFYASGTSNQQEYARSQNQQGKRSFQRDLDSEQAYVSFGQSQYSGQQNLDNFGRSSSLSYQDDYGNQQYGSEQQGQSMGYGSGQSGGFQKEDASFDYQNTSQQSDVYSSDTFYGNLSFPQGVSNQMQMHSTPVFKDRQNSRSQMDSGQEQGAFGSQVQTSPPFLNRGRSGSQMDRFEDSYSDSLNLLGSRNQRNSFEESYQDGLHNIYQATNTQMLSPRFSDPYQSGNLTSPYGSNQPMTTIVPNRRNRRDQRQKNQGNQRSRLRNQEKGRPLGNFFTRPNASKSVTVQSFFRNKYNKLKQTPSAKNNKSKPNLSAKGKKAEPPKAEFLSDLFSGKRSKKRGRVIEIEKTTGSRSPRTFTPSSRFKDGKNTDNKGKDSRNQSVVAPKDWAGKKSLVTPSKPVIKTEKLTPVSRLKPRTTTLPSNVAEAGNFQNRTRGLGTALETFKQDKTLIKEEFPVVKTEKSPSKDWESKSQTSASKAESQHKLTFHVIDNSKNENESAKIQDGSKTANKDKISEGEGSVTTLIFDDKGLKSPTGKEGSSEDKMDTSDDESSQKKKDVDLLDKFTYKMKIKFSITPAPASEPVVVKMKDQEKTVFIVTGCKADISEPYKDRVVFYGNTAIGDIDFTIEQFGLEDEGVYTASYNGMDFDSPFTKRTLYAKDKDDIVIRWTIPPVSEGGAVTVSKQNYLTLFTVTGDEVKATDEYKNRVVYHGDISKGTMLFVLKDCNVGDSGMYLSSYNGEETEGRHLKVQLRVYRREQRKRKETRLGHLKQHLINTPAADTSEKTLMSAADSVGLKLQFQCWCRKISPTEFRHFGVIRIMDTKDGKIGKTFFGKDVCLSTSSSYSKNEMRTQLFDRAVENVKNNSLDLICALGSKGTDTKDTSTGMWDIDTGEIVILPNKSREEIHAMIMGANRIDAQRILASVMYNKKCTNKLFIEAVNMLYDKGIIHLVDLVRSIRIREKFRKGHGQNASFHKVLRDNLLTSNEMDLVKIGKKPSLSGDVQLDRFVMFEGSDAKRRMVDAFQWILRSAESCGMLVHWQVRPVYGEEATELLPRYFKKCLIWIQGRLVGESCSYGEKYAIQHAAVDAMAYIYENSPVIQKVNKGLPEQYCITYKKAQAKAKLLMEVGNLDEEAAMIKACDDFILQYKDDPTPESLEFCKGFPDAIYESIKKTSLDNNMKVDTTQTDNRTVFTVSKTMDLYKLLGTLLENDGKSGRFRLMKQPECAAIAQEMRRIAENLLFIEESGVVDLTDEERKIFQAATKVAPERQRENSGAPEAKKGRFSDLVIKRATQSGSNRGSVARGGGRGGARRGGAWQGKARGAGNKGKGRGGGGGPGGVGRGFSKANFRGKRGRK